MRLFHLLLSWCGYPAVSWKGPCSLDIGAGNELYPAGGKVHPFTQARATHR